MFKIKFKDCKFNNMENVILYNEYYSYDREGLDITIEFENCTGLTENILNPNKKNTLGQVKINDQYISSNNAYTLKTQSVDPNAGIIKNLLGTGYVVNENYYLPKDETELVGSSYLQSTDSNYYNYVSSSWSEKAEAGQTKEIEVNGQKVTIKAMPKHGRVISKVEYLGLNFVLPMSMTYEDLQAFKA